MDMDPQALFELAMSALRSIPLVLAEPPVGGGVSGVLSGILAASGVHWHYRRRAQVLPHIPALAEAMDGAHDETTRFLAAVHEMTMSVTDAWNAARARKMTREKVEALIRTDALLPACAEVIAESPKVLSRHQGYGELSDRSEQARDAFDAAWTYRSQDNYRTETYIVTRTDSKGRTRTETRTRQVYEDTDHYFTFHRDSAKRAQALLLALLDAEPELELPVPQLSTLRVRLDAVPEAQRMFLRRMVRDTVLEDEEAEVTDQEVEHYANQWLLGADLPRRLRAILGNLRELRSCHKAELATLLSSNGSYHFNTRSRTHSGPPGFRSAQRLEKTADEVVEEWSAVRQMLSTCASVAEDLQAWATDHAEVESDRAYVKRAAEAYELAFPHSELEVDQLARHGVTAGVGVGSALFVGVATYFALGGQI